jgi:hypothetical protein
MGGVWPRGDWIVIPKNIGPHLSIDETCLSVGEDYTILSNKDTHGDKGGEIHAQQIPADGVSREMV